MEKPCDWCGKPFRFKPSREGRAKCCSKSCAAKNREANSDPGGKATRFQPGLTPWSKEHAKGLHLSPATEFKPGHNGTRRLPVGSVTFRTDKAGKPRAWVKIAEPSVWRPRAIVNWEAKHGPLPPGQIVHHRDRDSLNDSVENLAALTPAQHAKDHEADLIRARRDRTASA